MSSIPSNAWSTNNFTYKGPFTSNDLDNVPLLDIVRGNIILATLDGSGNINNNPTPFFILTTSKINNTNNFPNVPSTAYQQFMLVQGNSKTYGNTGGSTQNNQDPKNFYFSSFSSQVVDLVPLYAYYDSTSGGIEFFRADIFTDSYIDYITANPDYKPELNNLPPYLGVNISKFVYLCTGRTSIYGYYIYTYSKFLTASDIPKAGGNNYQTFIKFDIPTTDSIVPGKIYQVNPNDGNIINVDGGSQYINYLTSLGGTLSGGSSNNTNVSMGLNNVFYQNNPDNYIGTYYNEDNTNDWSVNILTNRVGVTGAGIVNWMAFQFIPLTYLTNPGFNVVPQAPSYLYSGSSFPYPISPLLTPYPTSLPTVKNPNYVNPTTLINTIYNWFGNTQSISCSTKVISSSYCGFTSQYYYNSLQGYFYDLNDTTCGASFDPPALNGFSPSCSGGTAACVPNFEFDLDITAPPFVCGPSGKTFSATDYYGMTYDNFIKYFSILPPTGIPYSLTSFKPRPYIDTGKISQNSEGTPKTTFWNSSVFIVLAVLFLILIIGIVIYFVIKQSKKTDPFSKNLGKYYS